MVTDIERGLERFTIVKCLKLLPRTLSTLARRSSLTRPAPIVIGGTGGSGTRAICAAMHSAGVYMGGRINPAGDALDFLVSAGALTQPTMLKTRSVDYCISDLPARLRFTGSWMLRYSAWAHIAYRGSICRAWGWKFPSTIYLLPYLEQTFPGMHYIHLVRDGRDMAFSRNQNQVRLFYDRMFPAHEDELIPLGSMRLWAKVNLEASTWCQRKLGSRYVLVRFEDLCRQPEIELRRIFAALDLGPPDPAVVSCVTAPDSLGRFQSQPHHLIKQLESIGGDALRAFGYLE